MAAKARSGTGSFRRLQSGRWECTLSVGGRDDRKRFQGYGRTQDDAYNDAQQQVDAYRDAEATAAGQGHDLETVGGFFHWWLDVACAARVEAGDLTETTRQWYARRFRLYIEPALGAVPLSHDHLDRKRIKRFFLDLLSTPTASDATQMVSTDGRHKIHQTLQAGLSAAVEEELLDYNPASKVKVPAARRARREEIPLRHARRLLAAVKGHRFEALYHLALHMPLRPGELTGMEWDQLNLETAETGTFHVRQNLVWVQGDKKAGTKSHWRLHDTKGHEDRRVPMPAETVRLLRGRRAAQAADRLAAGQDWHVVHALARDARGRWVERPLDLVFTHPRRARYPAGWPLWPHHLEQDLAALCEGAGIPVMTPHRLRHAAKTLLTSQEVEPHVVQQMGGWSDLETADLYTGVLMTKMREAVEQLARRLS